MSESRRIAVVSPGLAAGLFMAGLARAQEDRELEEAVKLQACIEPTEPVVEEPEIPQTRQQRRAAERAAAKHLRQLRFEGRPGHGGYTIVRGRP